MSCPDVMHQAHGTATVYFPGHSYPTYGHGAQRPHRMESPKDVQVDASLDPESEREEPREAEYLTPRCVLFTYFRGDTASVVDAHFSRALGGARPPVRPSACPGGSKAGAASAGQWKDESSSLTTQRTVQPSAFWSGAPPPGPGEASSSGPSGELSFTAATSLATHPGAAPAGMSAVEHAWHFHLPAANAAAYAHARPALHELYPAHLDPRYGHIVAVHGHGATPTSSWHPAYPLGGDAPQGLGSMDPGIQHSDKGKDLFWF
uniref:Transcription cofactor vestigial-like protein 2 n=2 Tax=Eptatretus burgeri TaxID=7764 RepID=A0A8C4WS86_EPTBU